MCHILLNVLNHIFEFVPQIPVYHLKVEVYFHPFLSHLLAHYDIFQNLQSHRFPYHEKPNLR